jgi:hypothetical protein
LAINKAMPAVTNIVTTTLLIISRRLPKERLKKCKRSIAQVLTGRPPAALQEN